MDIPALGRVVTYFSLQNLVYRYDVTKTNDGVGGDEGTFCLCKLHPLDQSVHLIFPIRYFMVCA